MRSRTNSKASWSLVSANCPGLGLIWTSDKLGVIFRSRESEERYLGKGSWGPFWGGFIRCGRQKVSWAGFWAKYLNLSPEPPSFPYLGKHPTSPNTRKVVQYPKSAYFFINLMAYSNVVYDKKKSNFEFSIGCKLYFGRWVMWSASTEAKLIFFLTTYHFFSWSSKLVVFSHGPQK